MKIRDRRPVTLQFLCVCYPGDFDRKTETVLLQSIGRPQSVNSWPSWNWKVIPM